MGAIGGILVIECKVIGMWLGCCIGGFGLCSVEEFQHLVPELLVWGVGSGI